METILPIIGAVVLIAIFAIIGYSTQKHSLACDILEEQFNHDAQFTKHLMGMCTKKDAAKLIDKFYERWHGLIPEWVICAHVMQLRRYLEVEHKSIKDITFNNPISKN